MGLIIIAAYVVGGLVTTALLLRRLPVWGLPLDDVEIGIAFLLWPSMLLLMLFVGLGRVVGPVVGAAGRFLRKVLSR